MADTRIYKTEPGYILTSLISRNYSYILHSNDSIEKVIH
jgi:hypothetical protein